MLILITLSLFGSAHDTATTDEVAHVPAGISYVQKGDFRINPEHPPLIKYLSGLSATVFTDPKINTSTFVWRDNLEWGFGHQTLYQTPGNNPDHIIFWGRLPVLLISVFLALVIFFWSRRLFGDVAALAALTFFCLDPTMITYSHLVTFDLPMTAFIIASLWMLWLGLKESQYRWLIISGAMLALASSSKVTAVAYAVIIPLIVLPSFINRKGALRGKIKKYCIILAVLYLSAFIVLWLVYTVLEGGNAWHHFGILPHNFIYSVRFGLFQFQQNYPVFIWGHLFLSGQWWFLPLSLLLKLPLVTIVFVIAGLILVFQKSKWYSDKVAFLVFPAVIFAVSACSSQLNVGIRYILIIFPLLFILAGYSFSRFAGSLNLLQVIAVTGAVVLYMLLSLANFFPNYLSYVNELAGGKNNGYKVFADTNIEWGQGLLSLRRYADQHQIKNMQIVYNGEAVPRYYGFNEIFPPLQSEIDIYRYKKQILQTLKKTKGQTAVSITFADVIGLNKYNYMINGIKPYKLISGSILLYDLQ